MGRPSARTKIPNTYGQLKFMPAPIADEVASPGDAFPRDPSRGRSPANAKPRAVSEFLVRREGCDRTARRCAARLRAQSRYPQVLRRLPRLEARAGVAGIGYPQEGLALSIRFFQQQIDEPQPETTAHPSDPPCDETAR